LELEDRKLLSTIVVNNPTDMPVAGETDLRQAIGQANSSGGDQSIVFDKTVFKAPQTITLNGTQLELSDTTGTMTITGPKEGVTVSGGALSRVFQVDSGVTASSSGMTITGGNVATSGGGIANYGTLTLTDCTVAGNSAAPAPAQGAGGGLANLGGTLTLTDCTVNGNQANGAVLGEGGGIYAFDTTLTLVGTKVKGNKATTAYNDIFDGP
jgi:hypothetical protein